MSYDTFGPLQGIFNAVSKSQKISSANIANAGTPGYTAREVKFSDLLNADNPFETRLSQQMGSKLADMDANTGVPVDLQHELIAMQKNLLFYSMVSRRTSTVVSNLKAAAQIGR